MTDMEQGVVISQETIERSDKIKKGARKSLAQLPVYREASNLKFVVVSMMAKAPNKLRRYFDQMIQNTSEICKSIGYADVARGDERVWYINCALVLAYEVRNDFAILCKLDVIVSRDLNNKAKAMVKRIIDQLVAWRYYTSGEGNTPELGKEGGL